MSGAGDSTVTAWVRLDKAGALYELVNVEVLLDAFVSKARDKVFENMPNSLKGVDGSQVKLCLSDEDSIETPSPTRIGALKFNKTLRSEVERLIPAWAITNPLYILAVVTGACGGRAWPSGRRAYGVLTLPPFF